MGLIIVGTDGSKGDEAAIREGTDLARRLGAKVLFVAVAEPLPDYLGKPLWQEWISGRGAVIGELLGSVSSGVVRRSRRPVVVVREPGMREAEEAAARAAEASPATA